MTSAKTDGNSSSYWEAIASLSSIPAGSFLYFETENSFIVHCSQYTDYTLK